VLPRKRGRNDHAAIVAKNEGSGVRKINVVCRAVPGQPCTLKPDRASVRASLGGGNLGHRRNVHRFSAAHPVFSAHAVL